MNNSKIINDPIFGFIKIPCGLLLDIVEHPLMQRLTRIKQLGLTSMVYPSAQHTRFQHSIGAFHLMSEAITSIKRKHSDKCIFHSLRFGCSFAVANTIKPELL